MTICPITLKLCVRGCARKFQCKLKKLKQKPVVKPEDKTP
jgi:hypothetical protein